MTNSIDYKISNLNDFENYRINCPFCDLVLKSESSKYMIKLDQNYHNYSFCYDNPNFAFNSIISSYIKKIIINKHSNTIIYEECEDFIFNQNFKKSALANNYFSIVKKCLCDSQYELLTSVIHMESVNNLTFTPEINSESFCVVNGKFTTKFINLYKLNHTVMYCFKSDHIGTRTLTFEKTLPLINFPFYDKKELLNKAKILLTFS